MDTSYDKTAELTLISEMFSSVNNASPKKKAAAAKGSSTKTFAEDDSGYSSGSSSPAGVMTSPEETEDHAVDMETNFDYGNSYNESPSEHSATEDSPYYSASTSSISNSNEESDDEDSMGKQIYFLGQKQEILRRATELLTGAEIDRYKAVTAIDSIRKATEIDKSIHSDAKETLKEMNHKYKEPKMQPPLPRLNRQKDLKREIDVISPSEKVDQVSSSSYDEDMKPENRNDSMDMAVAMPLDSSLFGAGQWMAKALIWSDPTHRDKAKQTSSASLTQDDGRWRLVSNPVTCSLGLMPPLSMSLNHGVDLQDAIAVSSTPQIVTQSTPPFCVVHVNGAFASMMNLGPRESIVGRPVESVFTVLSIPDRTATGRVQEARLGLVDEGTKMESLDSVFTFRSRRHQCRIQVLPVLDKSRRRRVSRNRHTYFMSHVLIRVFPSNPRPIIPGESVERKAILRIEECTSTSDNDASSTSDSSASARPQNDIVGTVG